MPDKDDIKNAEMLVKYGFYKKGDWGKDVDERTKEVEKKGGKKILDDGLVDMENMEFRNGQFINTSYPTPKVRHVLSIVDPNYSFLEKSYLWILDHILAAGFTKTIKITDTYGSSVGTDQWQVLTDRQKGMQSSITQLLQTIGTLVKDLFPMIHELTMWDERLEWHRMSEEGLPAGDKALKGAWTDVVEGGPENQGSIFGLARNAGFVTLPDLFFSTFVRNTDEVDKVVDSLEHGNEQVKTILKRKLVQYLTWRDNTKKEILQRKRFTVRYLRQHISAIELNMTWLAPYLRQMKYLNQNTKLQDDAAVISSFDTSKFEVETLCTQKNDNLFKPVVLVNVQYLSTPERSPGTAYQYSSFQHSGSMVVTFRGYTWTDEQIENYQKMREREAFELLGDFDSGFKNAMEELGNEIKKYIKEAEGEAPKTANEEMIDKLKLKLEEYEKDGESSSKKKTPKESDAAGAIYQPFLDVGSAFWEIGKLFVPKKILDFQLGEDKQKRKAKIEKESAEKEALGPAAKAIQLAFVNYRKAHKMVTW